MTRLRYYHRILSAYLTGTNSHLTFWHGKPAVNERSEPGQLGPYYMPFAAKADYAGQYDDTGIPMLDYRGAIGLQYNPIAIAQYGLGNYNSFHRLGDPLRQRTFLAVADWLVDHLEQNTSRLWVWHHHFDWEYRDTLEAPWYSALAQGQGISLLVRAYRETGDERFLRAATRAFQAFRVTVDEGGVVYVDGDGDTWLEEYIVSPPTHILNGFVSASWGVYDYALATGDEEATGLFGAAVDTLTSHLDGYDVGFWSLYEHSGTRLPMLASPFYHHLHVVQLRIMHRLTGVELFHQVAERWDRYRASTTRRTVAFACKALFKLLYY